MSIFSTTIHLYPTTTLRSMLTYMFIFYNLFDTYFVYFFINSLPQLFCLNFSTPISASIFVFFLFNHVSQQLNNLFHFSFLQPFANKQPSNSFFLATSLPTAIFVFYFQAFSTVLLPFSPLVFLVSDVLSADRQRPILEGSHVEARLFRVLGIVYVTFVSI